MAQTKVFFDLEYTGLHKLTTPISIAMVAEDGRSFYAEFTDFDKFQIDDYVRQHVLPKRILSDFNVGTDYQPDSQEVIMKGDIDKIFTAVNKWLLDYETDGVQMWGDMLAYDWVLFINIFGNGQALPKHIDVIPLDLCTALKLCGEDPHVDRLIFAYGEEKAESAKKEQNNALFDAKTSIEVYKRLMEKMANDGRDSSEEEEEEEEELMAPEEPQQDELKGDATKLALTKSPDENPPVKKGRGRPKKEKDEQVKKLNIDIKKKEPFVEPTQGAIDAAEEFNPPI